MNGWKPLKGEKIEAKGYLYNWENEGTESIKIGTFYIDNISYSGPPDVVNIKSYIS